MSDRGLLAAVLGLKSASSRVDVQRAFRERAKCHHPDAGDDAAKFRELVEAKERALDELAGA
jgi:curved DNA-binding protein CbpA